MSEEENREEQPAGGNVAGDPATSTPESQEVPAEAATAPEAGPATSPTEAVAAPEPAPAEPAVPAPTPATPQAESAAAPARSSAAESAVSAAVPAPAPAAPPAAAEAPVRRQETDEEKAARRKAALEAREAAKAAAAQTGARPPRAAAPASSGDGTATTEPPPPPPPSPNQPRLDRAVQLLRELVAEDAVTEASINEPNDHLPTIAILADRWYASAELFRHHPELNIDYLRNVAGVDYETHMEVIYHLLSLSSGHVYAVKVAADREQPSVPSVTPIWPSANWNEREIYDLLGIDFPGHPDLRRIMMPDDWVGHPLRKDYVPLDPEV